ncbi:MAG: phosphoribosylanthranilate isomerase [Acidobacteriales bacterium]|nr:phosphoribosylanthranilate isomerase [Terriglobales bacterium]
MKTWIKVCGTTNVEDARASVAAGADALGFIFAGGPREISAGSVAAISAQLPEQVERIGVFYNMPMETLLEVVVAAHLTGVQLHGEEPPAYVRTFLERRPSIVRRVIKTIQAETLQSGGLGSFQGGEALVDAVLIDSGSTRGGPRGGTGQPFEWMSVMDDIIGLEEQVPVIVAGGLGPENVGAAIALFHPFGVDAVSRLEQAKGKKDHTKLAAFVAAVRAAESAAASQ